MKHALCLAFFVTLLQSNTSAQWVRTHSLCYSSVVLVDSIHYYNNILVLDSLIDFATSDGQSYTPAYRDLLEYDVNGFVSLHSYSWHDGSYWIYSYRTLFTNDAEGNVLERTEQFYSSDTWVNSYRVLFVYDANGFATEEVTEQWISDAWESNYQVIYINGADGHISSESSYYYDGTWYPSGTSIYGYTSGLLTLVEGFDTMDEPLTIDEFVYNSDGNLTSAVYSTWESAYNTWLYNDVFYTYDVNENLVHEEGGYLEYTGGDTEYFETTNCDHYYEYVEVAVHEIYSASTLEVFPNPSSDKFIVKIVSDNSTIALHSMEGKLLLQQKASKGLLLLDISSVCSGNYVLTVSMGNELHRTKVIVN